MADQTMCRASDERSCTVRLHLLGGFALRVDGHLTEVQPVGQRLLAFLALSNAAMERSFTAFQLWPDTPEERARANLRSALWRLPQGPVELVTASKTHIRVASGIWVDVSDGLAEVRDGRSAIDELGSETTLHVDLLPDWYDDWVVTERERIRQLRLHALERHGYRLLDAMQLDEAIQLGLRAVAMEPLRESPHRLVMRCHLAEGNPIEAIRQYERYSLLLKRELNVSPSAAMSDLLSGCETALEV